MQKCLAGAQAPATAQPAAPATPEEARATGVPSLTVANVSRPLRFIGLLWNIWNSLRIFSVFFSCSMAPSGDFRITHGGWPWCWYATSRSRRCSFASGEGASWTPWAERRSKLFLEDEDIVSLNAPFFGEPDILEVEMKNRRLPTGCKAFCSEDIALQHVT